MYFYNLVTLHFYHIYIFSSVTEGSFQHKNNAAGQRDIVLFHVPFRIPSNFALTSSAHLSGTSLIDPTKIVCQILFEEVVDVCKEKEEDGSANEGIIGN